MRQSGISLALALGVGLAVGCTQNFDTFTVGGTGGDAAVADVVAGSGGADVSTGGKDAGKDASKDVSSDAPLDAPADAPPEGPVCGLGTKLCGSSCVLDTNPAFGCAAPGCNPCSFAHASASCDSAGACAIGGCDVGYADCDNDPSDGCETDLQNDANNCAGCGTKCVEPNATAVCTAGACAIGTCNSGYRDCDPQQAGCETNINSDPTHCGSCTKDCTQSDAGDFICSSGTCKVNTCPAGKGDCDGNSANGCETDLTTSLLDCGACGNVCSLPHATPTCSAGKCAIASCDAGYKDCDGDPTNGCEVDVLTSAANCGACGRACSTSHTVSQSCTNGACTPTCSPGYGDCSAPAAPNADNGCETNLAVNANNCGACGRSCSPSHVSSRTCSAGRCDSTCASGWGNCTQPYAPTADDGCETDTSTDTANCGACGRYCDSTNTTALACSGGVCNPTCVSGYDNCSSPAAPAADDGCETSVAFDPNNCGSCGRKCSSANVASLSCSLGKCDSLCNPGYANCTQPATGPDDGCETNTNTSAANCGGCGRQCATTHASATACSGGTCAPTCYAGYGDCNTPVPPATDDGCETNTNISTADCGACGHVCSTNHASATSCSTGKCSPTCNAGYADCTTPTPPAQDNGCESNPSSDVLACGACGRACSTSHVQGRACSNGLCTSNCDIGYVNCSTPSSPTTDDGCESASTDKNCGGCGNDCTAQGLTCSASLCSCTSNSQCGNNADCNANGVCVCHRLTSSSTCKHGETCGGIPNYCHCNGGNACTGSQVCCHNGCKDIQSDAANCGACGRACLPGFSCVSGSCQCSTNANCNAGSPGTCSGGVCSCGGTACAVGQRCLGDGSCG